MQGQIACANVLSDLYAVGVVECDNLLMLLASSKDMEQNDCDISTKLLIQGFNDQASKAQTIVTGGQSVVNPWPIIGGVAISMAKAEDFIRPENAKVGDKLVLTKALGTQIVVNLHQWLHLPAKWEKASHLITEEEVIAAYEYAIDLMARLNRIAAKLMHKYRVHAATDITGFGILGHATNLAKNQKERVSFQIDSLPIIKKMADIDTLFPFFKLKKGFSPETSGGLLISMPAEVAPSFCEELTRLEGYPAWIIGTVVSLPPHLTQNEAIILPNASIIDVEYPIPYPSTLS